jgi:hypothetical protein
MRPCDYHFSGKTPNLTRIPEGKSQRKNSRGCPRLFTSMLLRSAASASFVSRLESHSNTNHGYRDINERSLEERRYAIAEAGVMGALELARLALEREADERAAALKRGSGERRFSPTCSAAP